MQRSQPVRLWSDMLPTPLGEVRLVWDGRALCVLDFHDGTERVDRLLQRRFGTFELVHAAGSLAVTAAVRRYFDGDITALDEVPADPGGTPYQRRVWELLRTIPAGETRTYGQLAALHGDTHARAVGSANALNPVAIVIPCHRVIGANNALVGYAGGLRRKRWLLDHESRQRTLLPALP